jgi:hypothetical protein
MAFTDGLKLGARPLSWSPVISATSGSGIVVTLNAAVATRWSRWCFISLDYTFTNAGTGAGNTTVNLPIAGASAYTILAGRESGVDGRLLQCHVSAGSTIYIVYASDLTYCGQVGKRHIISGMYET